MADSSIKHDKETIDNSENLPQADSKEDENQKTVQKEDGVINDKEGPADSKLLSNDESDEEEKTVTDDSSDNEDNSAEKDKPSTKKLSEEQNPQTKEDQPTKVKKRKTTKSKEEKKRAKLVKNYRKKRRKEEQREEAKGNNLCEGGSKKKDSPGKNQKRADETREQDYGFNKKSFRNCITTLAPVGTSESLSLENKKREGKKGKEGKKNEQEAKNKKDQEQPGIGKDGLQDGQPRKQEGDDCNKGEGKTGKDGKKKDKEDQKAQTKEEYESSRKELLKFLSGLQDGQPRKQEGEDCNKGEGKTGKDGKKKDKEDQKSQTKEEYESSRKEFLKFLSGLQDGQPRKQEGKDNKGEDKTGKEGNQNEKKAKDSKEQVKDDKEQAKDSKEQAKDSKEQAREKSEPQEEEPRKQQHVNEREEKSRKDEKKKDNADHKEDKGITGNSTESEGGGPPESSENCDDECENDEQSQNQLTNVTGNSQEPNSDTPNVRNDEGTDKKFQNERSGKQDKECENDVQGKNGSSKEKETLQMASPLVFDIIRQTFFSLQCEGFEVSYSSLLEDYAGNETLEVLDEALNDAVAKANGVIDCHFVTVCLDAINKLMPNVDVLSDPADVSNSNSEIIICLRASVAIVKEPRGKQSIFRLLIAVSYLRSFLASLAELIHDTPSVLRTESKYSNLLQYLNSIFEVPKERSTNFPRKASTLLYFLKELKGDFSMYELRNLCEEASQLSILTSLPWTDLSMTPCHVFKDTDTKTQVKKALYLLMKSNDSSHVKDTCSKLSSNAKLRMAFVAVLMEDLYLPPIHIESMDKAADTITQLLPRGLSEPYKRLILFLTGKEDVKKLRDCYGHSVSSTKSTVIVLHLLAILTAEMSPQEIVDRPFFSFLLKPLKAAEGCVLANPDSLNQEPTKLSRVSTCFCGTAFVRSDEEKACPQHRKFCSTSPVDSRTPRKVSRRELSMCIAETAEDEFFVSDMTPSSFRILHLLVHSALFAGVSIEISTEDKLAKVLCIDATGSPVELCFKEVTNDLLVLQRLWGCSEDETISTVHQLIEDLSSLITKPLGGPSLTERSRQQWQKEFSEKIEHLLPRQAEAIPKDHPTSLETQIEEKDSTDKFSVDERNNWLPRLFRSTKEPTFDDLCSKFHTSTHAEKNRHPLVALFLKYFKTLPKDPHVYQLMNFSNMLEQRFGRRLSRSKAKKYIEDVIKEDLDHYEELKEALDKFCLSWEFVRPHVKRELGEEVPHLSETSPTSYFLVDPDSDGRFLQAAIQVLQRMQNNFQDEVLHIAMEGSCRTLDFLKKSDTSCTMPLVHVQDVVEDEIICFEWDDQILCHSHNNTDYGRGKEIFYDFEKIERELAGRFLMKKVYLGTPGGLRRFPYSNELFRTCSNVLNDVGQRIFQVPIDANMQNRLSVMKDKSLECVQDLLEHLEVIICWLAKTTHLDSDMLLLDYVERKLPKSNLLPPKLFQDPKREFKVCHVVSMYQTLEEIFSVFTSKNVSDKYRSVLSNDVKEWLQKATDDLGADKVDELTVVLIALRRFIFRYLLSDQDDHSSRDPHEDVVNQLDDPSLWPLTLTSYSEEESTMTSYNEEESTPVFKRLISEFVPRVMRAGEVYSVMTFYDDFVKSREKKKELAKKAPRKKTRPKLAASLSRFA